MEPYFRILFLIVAFFFGAILGSFACCQAWRIRLKEMHQKSPGKWSVCMSCGRRLKTSENIPIFSWLAQRGKCKKCGAKIGNAEILSELLLGLSFVAIGNVFFDDIITTLSEGSFQAMLMLIFKLLLLMFSLSIMWILVVYDAKWQKLPTFLLTIINICAILYVILLSIGQILNGADFQSLGIFLLNHLGSAALLAGPYFLLSAFSHEKLVGSGDWLVALPIALFLGHFWLALITLFLANTFGTIFGLYKKARRGEKRIPFGPFLTIAFIIVFAAQNWLMSLIAIL